MNKLVSFKLAKLLKEKVGAELFSGNMAGFIMNKPETINLPTIAEIVMYLYDKHGIWIEVRRTFIFEEVRFQSYMNEKPLIGSLGGYISHEEPTKAYEAAIEYVLKEIQISLK